MNKKYKRWAVALACSSLFARSAVAVEDGALAFSGFGTLGVVHSNSRDSDYRASIVHPNGAGKSMPWASGVDSKLGAQVSKDFGNGLTAVAQLVAEHRGDNSFTPMFEWANLKYNLNPNWYVRGGRVVSPTFMISDYRNVGYALTPVRQPFEVYGLNPITHLDGVDIGGRFDVGGGILSLVAVGGKSKDLSNRYIVRGTTTMGVASYEIGFSLFRAMATSATFKFTPYDSVIAGTTARVNAYNQSVGVLRSVPAAGYPEPNLVFDNAKARIWALGYTYDPGTWLLQAEYVSRKLDSLVIHDAAAWYLLGGYHMGKFTPYASYSRVDSREPAAHRPAVAPSAQYAMPVLIVNATDAASKPLIEQSTVAMGVRYELMKNVAIKAQFEHIRKPGSSTVPNNGMFTSVTLGSSWQTSKQSVNLLSATIDFVF